MLERAGLRPMLLILRPLKEVWLLIRRDWWPVRVEMLEEFKDSVLLYSDVRNSRVGAGRDRFSFVNTEVN